MEVIARLSHFSCGKFNYRLLDIVFMAAFRLIFLLTTCLVSSFSVSADEASPKLVVQITVDAFRADFLSRYRHMMGDHGFRYLLNNGVHYKNAHYQHANTETIVGHASLATGATPARHGMVGNVWYDRSQDRLVYNIEDPGYRLLSADSGVDQNNEIDPTQRAANTDGRSPHAMLAPTFSDELAVHFNGQSKIFGVSVKDRGAVSLAGHAGKAFWFSKASGEFVTSSYYYDQYPDWVNVWNGQTPTKKYAGNAWELSHPVGRYRYGDADDQPYETDFPGFGRTFPHPFGDLGDRYMTTRLTLSPAGDELTRDFALTLLEEESLGQDDVPDFLAISFSSTDYVGHIFGASSLESEDNIARLDATIASLLKRIDELVGLEHTLIVLSADHGQPEVPGHLQELGIGSAGLFDTHQIDREVVNRSLMKHFNVNQSLIEAFFQPYIYLDHELMAEHQLDPRSVQQVTAALVKELPGVYSVFTKYGRTPKNEDVSIAEKVRNNFHPDRSGDIYVVFEPQVFINDFDGLTVASTHGSPWQYDTHVPVIFSGYGLNALSVTRPVTPYDIAPTLSALLGIAAPAAAVGVPLVEVVE